jgi:hypothetical protein
MANIVKNYRRTSDPPYKHALVLDLVLGGMSQADIAGNPKAGGTKLCMNGKSCDVELMFK